MSDEMVSALEPWQEDIRDLLRQSVALQEQGIARFDKERYWRRRMGLVLAACAFGLVVVLAGVNQSQRQGDCDRANQSRANQRAEPVDEWTIAWAVLVGSEELDQRDALLDALAAGAAERNPPRDCSWPA